MTGGPCPSGVRTGPLGEGERVTLTDATAAGAEGPVPVRTYRPAGPSAERLPLVVNLHGGGWVLGSLDGADWLCSSVAASVGAVVVSVGYRLAPSHRWPAAARCSPLRPSTRTRRRGPSPGPGVAGPPWCR